jgi:hypothetical protein
MTECTFFDDEQPTRGLPQWATITQVSEFLDVSRNAIRSAVRRAVANNEDWVKKESKKGESTHYLIDMTHEIYQSHAQRWKENRGAQEEDSFATSADWYDAREALFSPRYRKATASPSYMGMGEQDSVNDSLPGASRFSKTFLPRRTKRIRGGGVGERFMARDIRIRKRRLSQPLKVESGTLRK